MTNIRISDVGRLAWLPSGRRTKWVVAVFWLLVVAAAMAPASKLTEVQSNDSFAWLPQEAESTQVLDRMAPFQSQNEIPTLIVYEREGGVTPEDLAAVEEQVAEIDAIDAVLRDSVGPIPSEDGEAIQVIVPIDAGDGGWETLGEVVDEVRAVVEAGPEGLDHYITGPGGYAADSAEAFSGIDGRLLGIAASVVVVILLFTYRSPVLWILPLVSAGVALFAAQAVVYFAAEYADLTVNAQSQSILTVLVFGAGTDYALLLVARYREELRRHRDRHEAMAFALHRAGPAIWASGATVIAGMLCLLLASMNSTSGLGPVCAIGIGVGLLVMLSLLPALLVICGRWVFWPKRPAYGSQDPAERGLWGRVGRTIARRPRATWVTTSVVLLLATFAVVQLDATGLRQQDQFYGKPEAVQGEEVVTAHFDAGSGQPVDVVTTPQAAEEVARVVADTPGIASVAPPVEKEGTAWIAATLADPADTEAARDTVLRVRDRIHDVEGANAQAGGGTAITEDILQAADRDNKVIIPAVLVVVFLILAGLLRAVVAPVLLIATVVLSFFAALGLSALLFKHVFGFAGADPGLPLFVFVFLVALGIDYNIFLMTRVHEEAKELGTRRGALVGLSATGGVITSAGLVLAGTFLALATLPVVAFAEIGMAVALGVLLDTIVVRAVLVTALNLDVGRWMWWPSALWRREGETPEPPPPVEEERELAAQQ
ncbi:MMPL family transporter [Nocardioides caldifontis]|uniref:MMPL family transporter n=1 Tax=Nocardioides caldifontis TaxID=2588938 RepID=UPI001EF06986|nr:MMPL family transporter [Nocardioides caldifontis]